MREAQYRWSYDYDEAGRLDDISYPSELTANIRSWQNGQFPPGHAVGYGAIYTGVPEATHPGQGRADDQGPPGLGDPGGEAWDSEVTFPPLVERETWDYDDAANIERRTRDGSWDQFTYEGLNRLVEAGSIDYKYTRAGEVREKRTPDGTTTLSWNSRGELIEARTAEGVTVRYGYDAFGRMVSRIETTDERMTPRSTDRSAYLWHERTLLAEYDVSEGEEANPYKEYFHVAGRLVAVKMYGFHGRREPGPEGFLHTKGGVMYYHTDRLGSPVAITDRHGEPVARYAWDAYGRAMAGIFEPYNSVGFTGHLYDQATGLTYFGARWYDAETGKFLSRDPIQDGWNWYAYVGGDPVNFVDLWGLEREPEALAVPGNGEVNEPRFEWPLKENHVTSPFGMRDDAIPARHDGIDLRATMGTPVYASGGGRVTVADLEYSRSASRSSYLIIQDDDGYEQRYVHMDTHAVEAGDQVRQGDFLGTTGTRKDTDPHLHFEIRKDGRPIDPETLLPKQE